MPRNESFKKTLMLGKIEGERRRGQQRMRWLDGITDSMGWVWVSFRIWWWTGKPGVLQPMGLQRVEHKWATELNWTEAGWQYTCHPWYTPWYTALIYSFPNLEPVCFSMSSSNCCFLTSIHISQEAGQVVWYSHLFQNFPQFVVIHSQRLWHSQ